VASHPFWELPAAEQAQKQLWSRSSLGAEQEETVEVPEAESLLVAALVLVAAQL
jgi:hypothetical protein